MARELELAGGKNRFGEPTYRVIWGYDRIVPMNGMWQEFGFYDAKLTDKFTGFSETRRITKLEKEVIEMRLVPKYLPGNCWHLEKWCPPEMYGTPEDWKKKGEEVYGSYTVDTSGPFPERGEYELCFPLTHDGSSRGTPVPLETDVIAEIVNKIRISHEMFSMAQRAAAIEQRINREEKGFVRMTEDMLKDSLRPFAGETFIVKP